MEASVQKRGEQKAVEPPLEVVNSFTAHSGFLVLGMGEQHYVGLSDLHPLKHVPTGASFS